MDNLFTKQSEIYVMLVLSNAWHASKQDSLETVISHFIYVIQSSSDITILGLELRTNIVTQV